MGLRWLPGLLAVVGLAIPGVADGFQSWPMLVGWLVVLVVFAWLAPVILPTRRHRITAAMAFVPVLFLLAWEGGWWLIPADVAWLLVAWRTPEPAAADAGPLP